MQNVLDLVMISAKFGFLRVDALIPDYNQKLDLPQAQLLQPHVSHDLDAYLREHETRYHEIFVALGKLYREVIQSSQELRRVADRVQVAEGGIGEKAAALKAWLHNVADVTAPCLGNSP